MDCSKIDEIRKNPNRESLTVDFKRSDVLKEEGPKKLLKHIVSFANRNGGTILIGILDDGAFEGKKDYDVKEVKQNLNNLIHNKIRPVLDCDIQFIPCKGGDVIVISIPKMKDIPHAVVKLKGGEIDARKYYIRTPDGKRLVSDRQLQYLFKNEELDFLFYFKFSLQITKKDFRILHAYDGLPCLRDFDHFFNDLPKEDKDLLKDQNYDDISHIFPYIMLGTLSRYLTRTWAIKLTPDYNFVLNPNVLKKQFKNTDMPLPIEESILSKFKLNLREYFEEPWIFNNFYLPKESEVIIDKGLLKIGDKDFTFRFAVQYTQLSSAGAQDYFSLIFNCFYEAQFNFPEHNFELYESFHQLALAIKRIIQMNWDYDSFLELNQHKILDSISQKLERLSDK